MDSEFSNLTVDLVREQGAPSLTAQLVSAVRNAIESGSLAPGARLPASRRLVQELGISRTVVSEAYATLVAEGYLDSRRGSGTFVAESQSAEQIPPSTTSGTEGRPRWLRREIAPPAIDPSVDPPGLTSFRICEPDPRSFPDRAWRTCARAALNERLPDGYPPEAGDPQLRRAVARFVQRERGFVCSAEEIVITSGTTQSLDLIARAVVEPGGEVAFENPGYRLARQIATDHGARIRPLAVDGEGPKVELLEAVPPPLAVYLTPSHQFPTGTVLGYRRRCRLLDWAARHDVLLIEDDYDSEFRFDGPCLAPMAAVGRGRRGEDPHHSQVVYLGTFSKSLAPSLRLGYLIAPPILRQAILHLRIRADQGPPFPLQRTLARYIDSGAFTRHLRRMRRLYRSRRDGLIAALGAVPEGAEWLGLAAGLHSTLRLPKHMDGAAIAARCLERGVILRTLADFASGPLEFDGLVLGHGALDLAELERMAEIVREAWGRK